VRDHVEVLIGEQVVQIFHGPTTVAEHRRSREPHSRVFDPSHLDGLWKRPTRPVSPSPAVNPLEAMGRSLADYAAAAEVQR
jgi:hypothetical protein